MKNIEGKYQFLKPITIGNNCFIGARTTILPGTIIDDNCIIGACSVVKGHVPEGSIVCGNPAKRICGIDEWTVSHIEKKDYVSAK